MTLEDLLVEHDYYCHQSNYYSNDPAQTYDDWESFYSDFGDADLDYNLVFRWDLRKRDNGGFYLEIFFMFQRKGIFKPVLIYSVKKENLPEIISFLSQYWEKLNQLWLPLSNKSNQTTDTKQEITA